MPGARCAVRRELARNSSGQMQGDNGQDYHPYTETRAKPGPTGFAELGLIALAKIAAPSTPKVISIARNTKVPAKMDDHEKLASGLRVRLGVIVISFSTSSLLMLTLGKSGFRCSAQGCQELEVTNKSVV
ncbi:MAG: hypothetical protein ABI383_04155 [Acidobacteriaceae bacterium]